MGRGRGHGGSSAGAQLQVAEGCRRSPPRNGITLGVGYCLARQCPNQAKYSIAQWSTPEMQHVVGKHVNTRPVDWQRIAECVHLLGKPDKHAVR